MNYYAYVENNKIIITDNKILDKKEISTNNILKNSDFESYINIIYNNYKKIGVNFSQNEDNTLFNLKREDDIFKMSNSEDQFKNLNLFFFQSNNTNKYIDDDIGDAQLKLENLNLFDCKKKILYDVSTEYFTNLFFQNERINEIFQFITNVLFQVMIKKYIEENNLKQTDIIFIYKGGTTMKILFEKYKLIIPNLDNYFDNKNFKRSDSDYSVTINPNIQNPNKHRKEIIKLSFVILNELRKVFSTCKNVLFDDCELNDELLKDFIEKFNLNLNSKSECEDIFKNIKIVGLTYGDKLFFSEDKYKNRFYNNDDIKDIKEEEIDTYINTDPAQTVIKKIGKILNRNYKSSRKDIYIENDKLFFVLNEPNYKSTKNSIYLSMNNNINQTHKTIEYNNFSLLRLKMNIIIFYINTSNNTIGISNAPSELIDLSVPKIDSDELKFMYENDIRKEIIKYKPTHTYLDFIYNGYSINGFIYDFIKQLYITSNPPWEAPKFEKRIQRFAFFILLSLLEIKNKNNAVSYKNLYENLEKIIVFFKMDYIKIVNNLDVNKILLEEIFKFFIINKHFSNIYLIKNYLLNLFDSNNNVYSPTKFISNDVKNYILTNPVEQLKYDSYRIEMIQNLEKIIILLKTLETNNIYIPFSPGVNIGVFNKYLKYKQKYLNLKKLL